MNIGVSIRVRGLHLVFSDDIPIVDEIPCNHHVFPLYSPSEQAALAVDFARATAPAGCTAPFHPERPWDERLPEASKKIWLQQK